MRVRNTHEDDDETKRDNGCFIKKRYGDERENKLETAKNLDNKGEKGEKKKKQNSRAELRNSQH